MSDSAHLPVPEEPQTPSTPTSTKAKKANPLIDLIDTEKTYVDNLTGIIRKVAGAWSRSNLPPPELDTMFRSIEGVYKANRGLHSKLKEIGANPQNPKALGDLLMGWIEDLQAPYRSYCNKYSAGFDHWDPVQRNQKLGPALEAFSATNPPNSSADGTVWTLDSLFLLPKARLKYYRKLYNRLLKSTAPGRSDHRLLVNALETLDGLLETLEHRGSIAVGTPAQPAPEAEDEVVINMRTRSMSPPAPPVQPNLSPMRPSNEAITSNPGSESGSARGSVTSGRLSRETANTSISRGSNATLSMPLSNLESRLSTERTLDIFTMNPKVVKLQMSPPGLTFTRELRTSTDVTVRFMSRATNQEVIHYQGHIYLLSDLFLICERMTSEEQAQHGNDGADMWLCYPPLAGKVLRISEVEGQDYALQVAIMRKEFLILETDSRERRDQLMAHFNDCIEFSGSLPPPSKVAPPPVPSLPQGARGQNDGSPHSQFDGPPPPNYQENNLPPLPPNDGSGPLRTSASAQPFNGPGSAFVNAPPRSTSFNAGPPGPLGMRPGMTMSPPNGSMSPPPGMGPGQIMQHPNGSMSPPPHMQPPFPPNQNMRPGPGPGFPPGQGGFPPGQGFPPRSNFPPGGGPPGPGFPPGGPGSGFPPGPPGQGFPPGAGRPPNFQPGMGPQYGQQMPPRPPSEPSMNNLRKSPSSRSVNSQYSQQHDPMRAPPMPPFYNAGMGRNHSQPSLHAPQARPLLPSAQPASRGVSMAEPYFDEPSPPNSPVPEMPQHTGPVNTVISAQMKCKVFLKQQHAQWKSLGSAKLKLYRQDPTNIKQLVVEADNKDKSILISTIVLTDGVERVGKTGVAVELSSNGARTGVVYMIQLRNEESTSGLFNSLLAGSDRANVR